MNIYKQGTGEKLVTFSQNVSSEGQSKWEELSIGLTAKADVQVEVICENTDKDNKPAFFDNLSVKVQAVPTVLVVQENHYYPFGLGMKGLDWVLANGKEDKYSFQGKEKQTDFDLNLSDFEARDFDYQTNRTWQLDPHAGDYYSLSPYSFLGNNPIRMIDPTGKNFGDIYNIDGHHVGNDGKNDNQVYVLNNASKTQYSQQEALEITNVINSFGKNIDAFVGGFNLTTETGLGHDAFLDRAHWVFGEGRGEAADAYAHAIQNSKEYGYHGQGFSESGIYSTMKDNKRSGKQDFFSGASGVATYDDFSKAKNDSQKLNALKGASTAIGAVIGSVTGMTEDPTRLSGNQIGATNWVGHSSRQWVLDNNYGGSLITIQGATRNHHFYNRLD